MKDSQEKKWCVYKHTNKVNGKVYIGQTCMKPKDRWYNGEGYKGCSYFYHAIQKYGWDNFEHEILFEGLTLEEANELEKRLIAEYDSTNHSKGYNLMTGGNNSEHSEETKEKLRILSSGRKHSEETKKKLSKLFKGRKVSLETRRKLSESHKGRKLPPEIIEKIKQSHLGKTGYWKNKKRSKETIEKMTTNHADMKGENNPFYGKKHTEETIEKIKKTRKRKQVRCIETDIIYESVREAGKILNCNPGNILKCCKGKRKTCGGYHWEYVDKECGNCNEQD